MATRSLTRQYFNGFTADLANGLHDFSSDVIKCMLVDSLPTVGTATNATLTEVTGTNYTAGGIDLGVSQSISGATVTLQTAVDTLWAEDATGFTDAVAAVVYNETSGRLICFGDMTEDSGVTPVTSADQDVDINWNNGSDILALAVA